MRIGGDLAGEVLRGQLTELLSIPLRLTSSIVLASNAMGFSLMTYVAEPHSFPNLTATIITCSEYCGI